MILLFYNLALLGALVASTPWWVWRMATTRKYREGLGQRLGHVPPWLRSAAAARPVVWVHAVSVGEVLGVSRLVQELERSLPEMQILLSTTTRTGQALARERFGANRVFYCPLDVPWAVRAYLDALRPRMLVLAETEFWPNLLSACFRRAIPVVVVNARISDRSWPRYHALRGVWRPFLSRLSRVLAQSETDAERLCAIGCQPERVAVAGNLKFDVRAAQESEAVRLLRAAGQGLRFVVAGSTLEGEEAALAAAWPQLLAHDPNLALVVAPRHPERFAAALEVFDRAQLKTLRRSLWTAQWQGPARQFHGGEIVLLDTIGELASVYALAAVAFVGGSLVPSGGHNPLEPAQFGVPIVMGPSFENFRAITEDLRAHHAIRIARKNELAGALIALLANEASARVMGERALEVFERQAGATARCVAAIREELQLPEQTA